MNKKIIIGIGIFIIVLVILSIFNYKKIDERIVKTIENAGFKSNSDNIYFKNISDLTVNSDKITLYFNLVNYELYEERYSVIDDVYFYFEPSYSYHSGKLNYSYRVVNKERVLLYTGYYDLENQELFCNYGELSCTNNVYDMINSYMLDFIYEKNNFISNPKFLKYMKKQDVEEQIQEFK